MLHGKERRRKKDLWSHLGIELGTFCREGCALTNSANPSSLQSVLYVFGRVHFDLSGIKCCCWGPYASSYHSHSYLSWIFVVAVDVKPEVQQVSPWIWFAHKNRSSFPLRAAATEDAPEWKRLGFNMNRILFNCKPSFGMTGSLSFWGYFLPVHWTFSKIKHGEKRIITKPHR